MEITKYDINDVMKYFFEISKIPRMSGKEEKIANYIENFAKTGNFRYIRDKYNNIVIIKEASKWNKSKESIILQCHVDMVCEKEEYSNHDFEKDGLDIYIDGDYIKAKDTTLGADNGIGMAIILAILNSNQINHPRIEAIFTTQEETTMEGAKKIDVSYLQGKKMICLDNMNEEELWIGCAGAKVFECEILCDKFKNSEEYILAKIGINGFRGGHSGKDIAKNRGNPIKEMGNLLYKLNKTYDIYIKNIYGGKKVNVIPRECYSEIHIKYDDFNKIKQEIIEYAKSLKENIIDNNKNINITIEEINNNNMESFDERTTKKIINIIREIPNGVYYKDKYENPLVSLNIGKIDTDLDKINISFSIRTNRSEIEQKLENEVNKIIEYYNVNAKTSELLGYEHKERSEFIEKCKELYKQCLNKKPKVIDMHICLEAGFFGKKISELDFIAIAPNIYDAHSPKERCSISSLKRIYNYIIEILKYIK